MDMQDNSGNNVENNPEETAIPTMTVGETDAIVEALLSARGASQDFKIGVLALAHKLVKNDRLKSEMLQGLIYLQSLKVTTCAGEVSILTNALRDVLGVTEAEAGEAARNAQHMLEVHYGPKATDTASDAH